MLDRAQSLRTASSAEAETPLCRVVRQFLEALLFEGCLDAVRVPCGTSGDHIFYFALGKRHFSCRGKVRGFGRIRLHMHTLAALAGGRRQMPALEEMLYQILTEIPGDTEAKRQLGSELLQTVYWSLWNQRHLAQVLRRHMDYVSLETHMREGHPYHPCFKARSGFSESDHRRFSSDCGQSFQLRWLAVRRDQVRVNLGDCSASAFWTAQGCAVQLEACRRRGQNPGDFCYVPVHPWQWCHYLRERLSSVFLAAEPAVLDLGYMGDHYRASQSQRTLINVSRPGAADIKLPLNIVSTSSRRHLLSHSLCAAPAISQWLSSAVEKDDFFSAHPLIILREFAGLLVNRRLYDPAGDSSVSHFSSLWRDPVSVALRSDERAVPMTALLAVEADGLPFIQHWIEEYGLKPWLEQLLRVVVLPVWHLLACHGLALEAHAQNVILIHRDGWPVRLAVRDFHESFEYVPGFVSNPEQIPDFAALDPALANAPADQFYWMARVDALRELYMDTLYIFHLSDLALICEQHYGLAETHFWQMLAALLQQYMDSGRCPQQRLSQLGHNAPLVRAESLIRKKLRDHPDSEYHHQVKNPFAHLAAVGAALC